MYTATYLACYTYQCYDDIHTYAMTIGGSRNSVTFRVRMYIALYFIKGFSTFLDLPLLTM